MNLFFHTTPTNKYSINTLVKAIEDIDTINIHFFRKSTELEKYKIDKNSYIISSFMDFNLEEEVVEITKIKKDIKIKAICGGPAVNEKNIKKLDTFDFIFMGEGEEIIRNFISKKTNDRIIKNENEIDINYYGSISEKHKRFGSIEITRGCLYNCFYCQTPRLFGNKIRHKKLEKIIEEIEILLSNNFRDIRFITPNIAGYGSYDKKPDLKKFAQFVYTVNKLVKGRGRVFLGSFPSEIRPEYISEDLCEILKNNTSSTRITIGAQSLSDNILKKINRHHTADDVIKAVEILYRYGFKSDIDFIFGFPFETKEDLKITKQGIELLTKKYSCIIHLHYFMPLSNTPFENIKPKEITKETRKYLSGLTAKKLAYGQWEKQIGFSLNKNNYFGFD